MRSASLSGYRDWGWRKEVGRWTLGLFEVPGEGVDAKQGCCQCGEPCKPECKSNAHSPSGRLADSSQQKGQEIPAGDVDVVPRILGHGVGVQAPSAHVSRCEGNDVLNAQCDDEGGVTECLHLVDLEGQPEGERCKLNHSADAQQRDSEGPYQLALFTAIAQKERYREECHELHRR